MSEQEKRAAWISAKSEKEAANEKLKSAIAVYVAAEKAHIAAEYAEKEAQEAFLNHIKPSKNK